MTRIATKLGTTAHRLEKVYLSALNSVDQIEGRKAESAKSGKFTADGPRADTLQFAVKLSPTFSRDRHQIAAAKREAAELRSKVKLQPTDNTDLVSAILRAEMRDFLSSKLRAERDAYIRENAEKLDPQMALAVIRARSRDRGRPCIPRGLHRAETASARGLLSQDRRRGG